MKDRRPLGTQGSVLRIARARLAGRARYPLALGLVVLAACFADQLTSSGPDLSRIQFTVTGDSTVALAGATTLTARVNGAPPSGGTIVIWASTNPAIASVDSTTGAVTGVTKDTVTITARLLAPELDTAVTATRHVRVAFASIAVDPVDSLTGLGDTRPLVVHGLDATAAVRATLSNDTAQFTLLDAGPVALDAAGVVRALAAGTARVEVRYEGLRDTALVKVRQVAKSVTIQITELVFTSLLRDTTVIVVARDTRDSLIASPVVRWVSGDPAAVAVSTDSLRLRALTRASATVTARVDTAQAQLPTRVQQRPIGLAAVAGTGQTDTVGLPIAIPPAVRVTDGGGAGVPNDTVTFSVIGGGGQVTGGTQATDTGGVATVEVWTLGTATGTNTLRAAAAGIVTPVSVTAIAVAGPPTQIQKNSVDSQTATVNTNVPTAPTVVVRDTFGNAAAGVLVTFGVTQGSVGNLSASTNLSGVASAGNWQLGTAAGTNTLTASAAGRSVNFTATGTSALAKQLSPGAGNDQTVPVHTLVPIPPSVVVRDSFGNTVPNVTVTFAVTAGGGSVTGGSPLSDANGLATVGSWRAGTLVGTNILRATSSGLRDTIFFTVTARAGAPVVMLDTAGANQSGTAGTLVAIAPAVFVADSFGNPVSSEQVTFTVTGGGGSVTGSPRTTGTNGIATVTSWRLGRTAGTNTLTASVANGVSVAFTASGSAGPAANIGRFSGNSQTGAAGTPLPDPYSVRVTDSTGLNGKSAVKVAWRVTFGGGSITDTSVTDAGGYANATRILGTAIGTQLAEGASSGLSGSPVPFTATAVAGAPDTIKVNGGNNQTATVNTTVGTRPSVKVVDRFGNPDSGVVVLFDPAPGSGVTTGDTVATNAAGIAQVGSWTLGTVAGANRDTLTATVGGLSVNFIATANAATATLMVAAAGDSQSSRVSTPVAVAPQVRVTDAYGNRIPGVIVTFGNLTGGGNVSGATDTTDTNGLASVGSWTLGAAQGQNTVQASGASLTRTFTATAVPAGAGRIALNPVNNGNNQKAAVGSTLPVAYAVLVTDSAGVSPIPSVTVSWSVTAGGGSVTPQSTTDINGIATATRTLGPTIGVQHAAASVGGLINSPIQFTDTATIGAPFQIAANAGDGQSAAVFTTVATPPRVRVADQFNNPSAGVIVTFAIGSGGGSLTGATDTTDASGFASVGSWRLGTAAGVNTLTATSGSLNGSPVTFTATGTPGAVALDSSRVVVTADTVPAGGSVDLTLIARDGFGNQQVAGGLAVSFTLTGGTSDGSLGGTVDNGNGTYTASYTGTAVGSRDTVRATVNSAPVTSPPPTVRVVAGAAAELLLEAGTGQSAEAGAAVATRPAVLVRDAFGNPKAGVSVTFGVVSGGGGVTGAVQATDALGVAAVGSWTVGTLVGANVLRATTAALPADTILFTAQGIPGPASPDSSIVTLSDDTVAAGAPITALLRVRDAHGNNQTTGGLAVAFDISTSGSIAATVDSGNGKYTSVLTFITVGVGTATASIGPDNVTSPPPTVTIVPGPVDTILVTPSPSGLTALRDSVQLTAQARDAFNNIVSGKTFIWASSDTSVAKVSASGVASAYKNGTVTITAVADGVTGRATVQVSQVTTLVVVSPSGAAISGGSQAFTALVTDRNGYPVGGAAPVWASLNNSVATMNSVTGVATAAAGGQVTVSASFGGKTGYALLTVGLGGSTSVGTWNTQGSPNAANIYRIWGRSASEAYAVGSGGAIWRWNGASWSAMTSPTLNELRGVWGSSTSDIFAVGSNGIILHYNGSTWSRVDSVGQNLWSVWGTSPRDVFAVSGSGGIYHYDGTTWTLQTPPAGGYNLYTVWGAAPNDVYAVGSFGKIVHYDGSAWSDVTSPTGTTLIGLWGTSATSIYAAGVSGVIVRYTGTWSTMTSPVTVNINDLWGTTPNEVYGAGLSGNIIRYNGTSWTTQPSGTTAGLYAVWGTSAGDVYAGGASGTIRRGQRGAATISISPASATAGAINSNTTFTATARDADGNVLVRTFTWTSSNTLVATIGSTTGIARAAGNGAATITAATDAAVGTASFTVSQVTASVIVAPAGATTTGATVTFTATARDSNTFAISGKTFAWASLSPFIATVTSSGVASGVSQGQATISASVDGKTGYALVTVATAGLTSVLSWSAVTSGTTAILRGIWGYTTKPLLTSAEIDYFAVGDGGTILTCNVSTCTPMISTTTANLNGVWGTSSADVWAVGPVDTVLHYNGTSWSKTRISTTGTAFLGVWGSAPNDVFVVGQNGTIYHYDGTSWAAQPSGVSSATLLYAVYGFSRSDVFAVGYNGTIAHYDGTSWSPMTQSVTTNVLRGVWGTAGNNVYVVGVSAALRYNGSSWASLSPPAANLYAIWGSSSSDVYAASGGSTVYRYNGSSWTALTSGGTSTFLQWVWGACAVTCDVLVVGQGGNIRRGTR